MINLFRLFSTDISFISSITWFWPVPTKKRRKQNGYKPYQKFSKFQKITHFQVLYKEMKSTIPINLNTFQNRLRNSNQRETMIHPKKLIEIARKWHKKSTDKGHFVVYTIDGERFMIPLSYLNSKIFEELLKMSEDEFGLSNDGPIVIPCNASLVRHMISLIRGQNSVVERKTRQNPLFLPVVGFSQQEAVC
jgi:Auxin responsive protein